MRIEAAYRRRSGFSDRDVDPEPVMILAFVEATYEPGYQRTGTKRGIVAVISDVSGRLSTAELSELTIGEPIDERPF